MAKRSTKEKEEEGVEREGSSNELHNTAYIGTAPHYRNAAYDEQVPLDAEEGSTQADIEQRAKDWEDDCVVGEVNRSGSVVSGDENVAAVYARRTAKPEEEPEEEAKPVVAKRAAVRSEPSHASSDR